MGSAGETDLLFFGHRFSSICDRFYTGPPGLERGYPKTIFAGPFFDTDDDDAGHHVGHLAHHPAYIPWLTDEGWGKLSVIIVEVWQWTPFMFLLLLAGLLSLPKEPYLAAAIDGAGPVRTFFYVTFPLMAPISIGAVIIRVIEASKILDTVYVLTSGGPGTATETSSFYIYIKGLREFQLGYSAAMSFTYLIIMIISLTIIAKLLHRLLIKT